MRNPAVHISNLDAELSKKPEGRSLCFMSSIGLVSHKLPACLDSGVIYASEVFTDEIRKINQIIIKEEGARASNGMNKFNLQLWSTAQNSRAAP